MDIQIATKKEKKPAGRLFRSLDIAASAPIRTASELTAYIGSAPNKRKMAYVSLGAFLHPLNANELSGGDGKVKTLTGELAREICTRTRRTGRRGVGRTRSTPVVKFLECEERSHSTKMDNIVIQVRRRSEKNKRKKRRARQ